MKQYNIKQLINDIVHALNAMYTPDDQTHQEAWWLVEALVKKSKTELLQLNTLELSEQAYNTLQSWINQRVYDHKPLQYILGSVPFLGLDILVEPPILIPRPETEEWVDWIITHYKRVPNQRLSILDLCSGSGCIGLALAKAFPSSSVTCVDINPQAIALGIKNAAHNTITNIQFIQSNLYDSLDKNIQYDLIVANPPYITHAEYEQLAPEVYLWEDKNALVAERDGLLFYEVIIKQAPAFLHNNGFLLKNRLPQLVLETGIHNNAIVELLEKSGFSSPIVHKDMQGSPRWISAYLTEKNV